MVVCLSWERAATSEGPSRLYCTRCMLREETVVEVSYPERTCPVSDPLLQTLAAGASFLFAKLTGFLSILKGSF